ncbi:hypothetical protein GCM10010252_54770 [Streptomyces aureoverticillatus]|nr:hypothetical protein GCM10010252_54770 [Streptomyces aureoverticillatus]
MGESGGLPPWQAGDTAEFLTALRQLKERSGLTYRQLEQRAAAQGEVLARSTLADVLSGKATLRPELLAAFIRACGEGGRTAQWLAAWDTLSSRDPTVHGDDEPPSPGVSPRRAHGTRMWLLTSLAALSLVCATAWVVLSSGESTGGHGGNPPGPEASAFGDEATLPGGRVRIRPVLAPDLCLTDGHVRGYEPLVAVQRPCDEVAPQETLLEPLGGSAYRIRWYHPDHGKACLKALRGKPADGLLEPWEACDQSSKFRFEPRGPDGSRQFALRVAGQGCVGIQGAKTTEGAAALMEPCQGKRSHLFVIEPAP